jgi:hypothetical protein
VTHICRSSQMWEHEVPQKENAAIKRRLTFS